MSKPKEESPSSVPAWAPAVPPTCAGKWKINRLYEQAGLRQECAGWLAEARELLRSRIPKGESQAWVRDASWVYMMLTHPCPGVDEFYPDGLEAARDAMLARIPPVPGKKPKAEAELTENDRNFVTECLKQYDETPDYREAIDWWMQSAFDLSITEKDAPSRLAANLLLTYRDNPAAARSLMASLYQKLMPSKDTEEERRQFFDDGGVLRRTKRIAEAAKGFIQRSREERTVRCPGCGADVEWPEV